MEPALRGALLLTEFGNIEVRIPFIFFQHSFALITNFAPHLLQVVLGVLLKLALVTNKCGRSELDLNRVWIFWQPFLLVFNLLLGIVSTLQVYPVAQSVSSRVTHVTVDDGVCCVKVTQETTITSILDHLTVGGDGNFFLGAWLKRLFESVGNFLPAEDVVNPFCCDLVPILAEVDSWLVRQHLLLNLIALQAFKGRV